MVIKARSLNSCYQEPEQKQAPQPFQDASVYMVRSGKNGMKLREMRLSGQEDHQDRLLFMKVIFFFYCAILMEFETQNNN